MPPRARGNWTVFDGSCKTGGMNKKTTPDTPAKKGQSREDRLKSALKANLARRKAQMRARGADEAGKPETGGKDKG
ncbi:hypothetical protein SAMN04488077_10669 [Roseovarius tolerans]|uniref:Uncharacterized protein n=2 Tax=Roseovarius tolerans TaxID=74031 RepID=A0A1H7ZS99_9RHOB|nr:hypothetical protein SAMN04488077_10669 [Roseovarius tolerans]